MRCPVLCFFGHSFNQQHKRGCCKYFQFQTSYILLEDAWRRINSIGQAAPHEAQG